MDRLRKYLRILLPALFIAYLGCIIAFTHVHIVNGVTIVHSHPFHKTDDGRPDHEPWLRRVSVASSVICLADNQVRLSSLFCWRLFIPLSVTYLSLRSIRTISFPSGEDVRFGLLPYSDIVRLITLYYLSE